MIQIANGRAVAILDDIGAGLQVVSLTVDGQAIRFAREPLFQLALGVLLPTAPGLEIPLPYGTSILIDTADLEVLPENVASTAAGVEITWPVRTHFGLIMPTPSIMTVKALIRLDDDELVFQVKVDARLTGLPFCLSQVTFPRLRFEPIGDATTDVLTFPWQQGGLLRNPAQTLGIPRRIGDTPHPSTAVAMQWFAYYSPGGPMAYLRTTDSEGQRKGMEWIAGGTNTLFALTNYPINSGRVGGDPDSPWSFDMLYELRLTVMLGTWYDAARRYRAWALTQPWAQRGPIATSSEFSSIVRNADITVVRGRTFDQANEDFEPFIEDMLRIKAFFGTSKIASVWANWNYERFATRFPDYTIKPTFAPAVKRLAAEGVTVTPYTWRSLWSIHSEAYRSLDGRNRAAQDAFGRPVLDVNPYEDETTVTINPTRESSRELAIYHWRRLVEATGVRALYTDHWSGIPPAIDGNPSLPRTGGADWQRSKRQLGLMFKHHFKKWNGNAYEDPDFLFASEFVDESVIDMIEIASNYQLKGELYDSFVPAPLYAVVYHDYGMVAERLMDRNLLPFTPDPWELATHYHGGRLFAPINPIDDAYLLARPFEATPKFVSWEFMRTLVQANPVTRRYQLLGEKLRPLPGLLEDQIETSGWDGDVMSQGSVWSSGDNIGILLTNTADAVRVVQVRMRGGAYPIPVVGTLFENREGERIYLQEIDSTREVFLDVEMSPRSLRVFEVLPIALPPRRPIEITVSTGPHGEPGEIQFEATRVLKPGTGASIQAVIKRLDAGAQLDVLLDGSDNEVKWDILAYDKATNPTTLHVGVTSVPTAWVRGRAVISVAGAAVVMAQVQLRLNEPPRQSGDVQFVPM